MTLVMYLILISFIIINVWYFSLVFAIYIMVLDFQLAISIVYLEMKCMLNPKIKTVSFLVMMNIQLKEEIERIIAIKDIDLWKELKKEDNYKEITLNDIKKIKSNAKYQLKISKDNELISFEEVDKILENEGLKNFLYSIKRTVNRYDSFEQREKFVGSKESTSLFNVLFRKKAANEFSMKDAFYGVTFHEVVEKSIEKYKKEFLMTGII